MNSACQELVNAQIEVNRAVLEANKEKPSTIYLAKCIAQAIEDLVTAGQVLLGIRRCPGGLRPDRRKR
jgi:hypothetical protein